jgi:cytochrome c peroxidase
LNNRIIYLLIIIVFTSCRDDDNSSIIVTNKQRTPKDPTPYTLQLPEHFTLITEPNIPESNPLTVEGIELGKKLFFEKKLSKNEVLSCSSCHNPSMAFSDVVPLSSGADGSLGLRNAMPLFNLAFNKIFTNQGSFNWHGGANSIEEQAFGPVTDLLEMQETWPNVVKKIQSDPSYPALFEAAFKTLIVDSTLIVKAIAQFERTLISGESKMDNQIKKDFNFNYTGAVLNPQEFRGYNLYLSDEKGDCFHCHGIAPNPLWTDYEFRNNGLDANPDSGLAANTKLASDLGKFKTPSLRNLVYTSPYMHDGRFQTLNEVVDFYMDSIVSSATVDPTMLKNRSLTAQERLDLVAFLEAITDTAFVSNLRFRQ